MGFFQRVNVNTTSSTSTTIQGIANQVTLVNDSSSVPVGILYNPTKDILFVYRNSVYLSPDNYNVVNGNIVSTNEIWDAETVFDFLVQKVT